jgi:hypothetical protein
MELFLNLVWVVLSAALILYLVRSRRALAKPVDWRVVVALGVLLVLLFPVISMTDDLAAMTASAEVEYNLRLHEAAPAHQASFHALDAIPAAAILPSSAIAVRVSSVRFIPLTFSAVIRAGFIQAVGVRPPPHSAFSLA